VDSDVYSAGNVEVKKSGNLEVKIAVNNL